MAPATTRAPVRPMAVRVRARDRGAAAPVAPDGAPGGTEVEEDGIGGAFRRGTVCGTYARHRTRDKGLRHIRSR